MGDQRRRTRDVTSASPLIFFSLTSTTSVNGNVFGGVFFHAAVGTAMVSFSIRG